MNSNSSQENQNQQIPQHILQEISKMNRREKYLYERDRGRLLRFDNAAVSDRSAFVEEILDRQNMHIALNRALNTLSASEYRIIQECFFGDEKVSYSFLCKKYGISRQAYVMKLKRILLKLKKLVTYYYNSL